jgi:hypothetical protein
MQDALWALSYLIQDANDEFISQVCQGKSTIPILIKCMKSHLVEESTPAIRAIANIMTSSSVDLIDQMIHHGVLDGLNHIMTNDQ